jgi:hypothetical protein
MARQTALICFDCGTTGPHAERMPQARVLAEQKGWLTGRKGAERVPGWDADFCPACAPQHPRHYCSGDRVYCDHRSIYTITREKDGKVLYACGSHATVLLRSMVMGGNKVEIEETPA